MTRTKYRFDHESLSYIKIRLSLKQKIFKSFPFVISTVSLSLIFTFLYPKVFESPTEKRLKREIDQLVLQYEIINEKFNEVELVLTDIEQRDDNIYRTVFSAEPVPSSIRSAGYGGSNRYIELRGYENSELIIETAKRIDIIQKKLVVQSKSYDEVIELAMNQERMLASVPAIQPVSNKDLTRVASGWGWRIHPIYKIRKFHYGIDFTAPTGTEIYATGDGEVSLAKVSRIGYGREIIIDHGFGYETLYGHLSKFKVKKGDHVKRGDVIGYIGNSGTSTAPHLHYEVLKDGKKIDPKNYFFKDLSAEEYDRMIELSSNSGKTFD